MKTYLKNLQYILLGSVFLFTSVLLGKDSSNCSSEPPREAITAESIVGIWWYNLDEAPNQYKSGYFSVEEDKGSLMVIAEIASVNVMATDIEKTTRGISFNLKVENKIISFTILRNGDDISGESTSVDGIFKLEGTREILLE